MAYREPGVYLEVQENPRGVIVEEADMIPLIIGSGAKKLTKTVQLTRADSGQVDTFPYTSVQEISRISSLRLGASEWVVTTDYTFTPGTNEITWEAGEGPDAGSTYYADLVIDVEADQYELTLCSSVDDVVRKYGPDIKENEGNVVCPVSLAAQIALNNGSPAVYVLQVNMAGSTPTSVEYSTALNTYAKFEPAIWRIVPADVGTAINQVCLQHANLMSSYEERQERSVFGGTQYTTDPAAFDGVDGVLALVGGNAAGVADMRFSTIYPDRATMILSDGVARELNAPFILAALAGASAAQPPYRSYTRMGVGGFIDLVGVKMSRSEMNQLANLGVMVLTQQTSNFPIVVRHGITTDMSTVQRRENSILQIRDYVSKFLRNLCEPYIGRENISPELVRKIRLTINDGLSTLNSDGVIIGVNSRIDAVNQDEANPDIIIASLTIAPPYPLNYIDITLVLD